MTEHYLFTIPKRSLFSDALSYQELIYFFQMGNLNIGHLSKSIITHGKMQSFNSS